MKILKTWWRIGEEVIGSDEAGEPKADDIETLVFMCVGSFEITGSHCGVCGVQRLC